MKIYLPVLMGILALSVPVLCAAGDHAPGASNSPIYLMTNDDATLHSYVSFYQASGTQGTPTLNYLQSVLTHGVGIAGGFFGTPRLAMVADPSAQCLYASDASTGDIAALNIQSQQLVGNYSASSNDDGTANGIGIVMNKNYLYAGYTLSNTIATFAVGGGCQLSFLGDITVTPLNGGYVAGMAVNGNILVVTYIDGSIQSFNIANGIPMSNNDEQNATGFASAYFPDGVDITQDGHFAIFADAALPTVIEVSDLSSGKLGRTVQYTLGSSTNGGIGIGVNSASLRLSPDGSLLYVGNSQSGNITALFFNKNTGKVTPGCASPVLNGFYNTYTYVGALATRDTTGTGNVLYAAEFGSSIAIIKVTSTGASCTLTESAASPVSDNFSVGLLSITVFPPRPF